MTYWKTPSFKALQQAWYEQLENDGFCDLEKMIDGDMVLTHRVPDYIEITEQYYQIISQKIHETTFRNEIERLVLTSYCEGKKAAAICQELRSLCRPPCFHPYRRSRHAVRFIVRRYEMLWGIREYTPRQLGKKVS